MNEVDFKLRNAPIVEAVVDVDCDMPSSFEITALETLARDTFGSHYPKNRPQFLEDHRFEAKQGQSVQHSAHRVLRAYQFLHADEKQLVQVRVDGYSFNRLAPYTTLNDYLPEIERTWRLFVEIAAPVQVRVLKMRYINRFLLPLIARSVDLDAYLKIGPRSPDEERLTFVGFLNQHVVVEMETGHQATIVLASQPAQGDKLPVILDISVAAGGPAEPDNWLWILDKIQRLRELKNRIFRNTLTERCLDLFQQ